MPAIPTSASGDITLGGVTGGSLTVANNGPGNGNIILGGNVTTTGNQTYSTPVLLGGNDTLTAGSGGLTFSGRSQR